MAFIDDIKNHRMSLDFGSVKGLSFSDFRTFINHHSYFITNYQSDLMSSIRTQTPPPSAAVSALFEVYSEVKSIYARFSGEFTSSWYLRFADLVAELTDDYTYMVNTYYLLGFSDEEGFSKRRNYIKYTIPKDYSLAQIAKKFFGSTEDTYRLFDVNPGLIDKTPEEYRLTTILIPVASLTKAAISSNIGEESWGVDLPNSLATDIEGDLETLSYKDSLLQGILNISCYGLGSIPESPNLGNAFINDIGEDFAGLNQMIAINLLKEAILDDTAVEEAVISDLNVEQDALTAKIKVKPINTENIYEINL